MANTSSNVTTGKPAVTGAVYKAPIGTSLPADATTTLNTAFVSLGYVSEDGLSQQLSIESDNIKAWGGDVVQNLETSREDTFTFTLIESLNPDVLKAVYGDSAVTGTLSGTSGIKLSVGTSEQQQCSWAFEMIMKNGVLKRIVIPSAAVTEIGEVVYKADEVVGYEITLTASLDSSGNYHYEYMKAPSTSGEL